MFFNTLSTADSASGLSFCSRYCFPKKIAILESFLASAYCARLKLVFPFSLFIRKTSEKLILYSALHHAFNVLSETSNTAHISDCVHWSSHSFSNVDLVINFFGLALVITPFVFIKTHRALRNNQKEQTNACSMSFFSLNSSFFCCQFPTPLYNHIPIR